jgi:hypothetical protein
MDYPSNDISDLRPSSLNQILKNNMEIITESVVKTEYELQHHHHMRHHRVLESDDNNNTNQLDSDDKNNNNSRLIIGDNDGYQQHHQFVRLIDGAERGVEDVSIWRHCHTQQFVHKSSIYVLPLWPRPPFTKHLAVVVRTMRSCLCKR